MLNLVPVKLLILNTNIGLLANIYLSILNAITIGNHYVLRTVTENVPIITIMQLVNTQLFSRYFAKELD